MRVLRIGVTVALVLVLVGGGGYLFVRYLDSFRARGDISLRPRLKPGAVFTVSDVLTHGDGAAATRW